MSLVYNGAGELPAGLKIIAGQTRQPDLLITKRVKHRCHGVAIDIGRGDQTGILASFRTPIGNPVSVSLRGAVGRCQQALKRDPVPEINDHPPLTVELDHREASAWPAQGKSMETECVSSTTLH